MEAGGRAFFLVPSRLESLPPRGLLRFPLVVGGRLPVYTTPGEDEAVEYTVRRVGPRVAAVAGEQPPVPLDLVAALLSGGPQARKAWRALEEAGGTAAASRDTLTITYKAATIMVSASSYTTVFSVDNASPAAPPGLLPERLPPATVWWTGAREDLWELSEKLPPLEAPGDGALPAVEALPLATGRQVVPAVPATGVALVWGDSPEPFVAGVYEPVPVVVDARVGSAVVEVRVAQPGVQLDTVPVVDGFSALYLSSVERAVAALAGTLPPEATYPGPVLLHVRRVPEQSTPVLRGLGFLGARAVGLRAVRGLAVYLRVERPGRAEEALARLAELTRPPPWLLSEATASPG